MQNIRKSITNCDHLKEQEDFNKCKNNVWIIEMTLLFCEFIIIILMFCYLPIDPIDKGIIINEQALLISSKYYKKFTNILCLSKFKEFIESQNLK